MKRNFLILFLVTNLCFCQEKKNNSFEDNFNLLIENLTNENWTKSEKLAKELLNTAEPIDSLETEKQVLRYMYIYSTAGLLNEKKLTQKEALQKVKFLQSKEMIMPAHPFNSNCYVNCTSLKDEEPYIFYRSK